MCRINDGGVISRRFDMGQIKTIHRHECKAGVCSLASFLRPKLTFFTPPRPVSRFNSHAATCVASLFIFTHNSQRNRLSQPFAVRGVAETTFWISLQCVARGHKSDLNSCSSKEISHTPPIFEWNCCCRWGRIRIFKVRKRTAGGGS